VFIDSVTVPAGGCQSNANQQIHQSAGSTTRRLVSSDIKPMDRELRRFEDARHRLPQSTDRPAAEVILAGPPTGRSFSDNAASVTFQPA
jgi:hypothetical protein